MILGGTNPAILEKPSSKGDQLDMLESYRGADVQVATGVTLGTLLLALSCEVEVAGRHRVRAEIALFANSATSTSYAWIQLYLVGGDHQGEPLPGVDSYSGLWTCPECETAH